MDICWTFYPLDDGLDLVQYSDGYAYIGCLVGTNAWLWQQAIVRVYLYSLAPK